MKGKLAHGDDNIGQILGYDNIIIEKAIIENIALVEKLKRNLLSTSQITYRGYHVTFYEEHCEMISNTTGKIALTSYRHGNIYEANHRTNTDDPTTCLISKASVEDS